MSSRSRCGSAAGQIRVQLTHDEERYLVDEGEPLEVIIRGARHLLSPGTAVVIKRPPA